MTKKREGVLVQVLPKMIKQCPTMDAMAEWLCLYSFCHLPRLSFRLSLPKLTDYNSLLFGYHHGRHYHRRK